MPIYTRTGDAGTTSLVGGKRVSKASVRLEAYGTIDELNSHLGLMLALGPVPPSVEQTVRFAQHRLFNIGSLLACEPDNDFKLPGVTAEDVRVLERAIDAAEELLPRHMRFILPGGVPAAAEAHVARTVARRAERRMVAMQEADCPVSPEAMRFINRLSDYLFVAARLINHTTRPEAETYWEPEAKLSNS